MIEKKSDIERLCTQIGLRGSIKTLVVVSAVLRLQLSSYFCKTLFFKDIIERSPLKARLGDVSQECWVNSILNLLCLCVLSIIFL